MQNNQDYITAFIEGYICAIIGERMTTAKVSEAELDTAKHAAEKYVEYQIEHSNFSEEEKKAMKKDYKLWAESALQGMKNDYVKVVDYYDAPNDKQFPNTLYDGGVAIY